MTGMRDGRSISHLLSDVFRQMSVLMRSEIDLAQAELAAKATGAAVGIGLIFGAVLFAGAALVLLLLTIAALLRAAGLSQSLAYFLAAGCGLVVGGVLAAVGLQRVRADALKPQRTIGQLQRDASVASAATGRLS